MSNTVSNINTYVIVAAPITHTQKKYPIFVPLMEKRGINGTVIRSRYADLSNARAVSSYRLAGFICELYNSEIKQIDAAMARHLDLMHHYKTLVKSIEDKKARCGRYPVSIAYKSLSVGNHCTAGGADRTAGFGTFRPKAPCQFIVDVAVF